MSILAIFKPLHMYAGYPQFISNTIYIQVTKHNMRPDRSQAWGKPTTINFAKRAWQ